MVPGLTAVLDVAVCGTSPGASCVPMSASCVTEDTDAMCPSGQKCCADGNCEAMLGQVG